MALSIQIPEATFARAVASLTQPSVVGLVSEHLFGVDEATSIVNWADPSGDALTPVGSAVYGSNYAEIKSGGYGNVGFELPIACPNNATIIVVVQKQTGLAPFMSTDGPFTGFHNFTNVPSLYNSQSGTLANVANVAVPAHSDFAFFAGQLPLAGKGKIYTYESGVLTADVAESPGSLTRGPGLLKIGTALSSSGAGVTNIAYAAVFNRLLSDAEIAASYASLKSYLARRGVTVS